MQTRITATELARNLSDILNRVRYKGEKFIVVRNGEAVASIEPPSPPKQITLGEFLELLKTFPKPDPEYWDELEQIQANQPKAQFPEWPS
ncbi:MAG: type II toxin-antitoxin system prevent-host-death family antitoxin [Chloroflexi bacterium]|nr:type II toxin-antitoxin system prevent-host-death family antitoxin [Chloroflexota bacterium]